MGEIPLQASWRQEMYAIHNVDLTKQLLQILSPEPRTISNSYWMFARSLLRKVFTFANSKEEFFERVTVLICYLQECIAQCQGPEFQTGQNSCASSDFFNHCQHFSSSSTVLNLLSIIIKASHIAVYGYVENDDIFRLISEQYSLLSAGSRSMTPKRSEETVHTSDECTSTLEVITGPVPLPTANSHTLEVITGSVSLSAPNSQTSRALESCVHAAVLQASVPAPCDNGSILHTNGTLPNDDSSDIQWTVDAYHSYNSICAKHWAFSLEPSLPLVYIPAFCNATSITTTPKPNFRNYPTTSYNARRLSFGHTEWQERLLVCLSEALSELMESPLKLRHMEEEEWRERCPIALRKNICNRMIDVMCPFLSSTYLTCPGWSHLVDVVSNREQGIFCLSSDLREYLHAIVCHMNRWIRTVNELSKMEIDQRDLIILQLGDLDLGQPLLGTYSRNYLEE